MTVVVNQGLLVESIGAAILIAASQIKNFFGLDMPRGAHFHEVLIQFGSHLGLSREHPAFALHQHLAAHARRVLVFSHPPRNALTRAAVASENTWFRLTRWAISMAFTLLPTVAGSLLNGLAFYAMNWSGQHALRRIREDLFAQGAASVVTDPATVDAALTQPGVVLSRAIGATGAFHLEARPPAEAPTTTTFGLCSLASADTWPTSRRPPSW